MFELSKEDAQKLRDTIISLMKEAFAAGYRLGQINEPDTIPDLDEASDILAGITMKVLTTKV
jgi:hypothetical protein